MPTGKSLLEQNTEFNVEKLPHYVGAALKGADDGELYIEKRTLEVLSFEGGLLRTSSNDVSHGFGLRRVVGDKVAYMHSTQCNDGEPARLTKDISTAFDYQQHSNHQATINDNSRQFLYTNQDPRHGVSFEQRLKLLGDIDAYARSKDSRLIEVVPSIVTAYQLVGIVRIDGQILTDVRPMVRMSVYVVLRQNDRTETGSAASGGRFLLSDLTARDVWSPLVDQAIQQAEILLNAIPAPAGEMPVVLGPGWPGVLLHEAIGHGLEGDFNRKGTSAFSNMLGQRVAAPGVTVVDDGTLLNRRGSLNIDDEGTQTQCTTLIEDGILKGYMQDRLNARLMGVSPTGNGRRQSFAHMPMPRMTNTYMLGGSYTQDEIIRSVKRGIFARNFGGGQVDITSGKFVFSASEAYLIEDGKVTAPLKGATLIGHGPDALTKVTMIGNDMELDPGIGTCGKQGQSVPVGVGQPSLLISAMTVGGVES